MDTAFGIGFIVAMVMASGLLLILVGVVLVLGYVFSALALYTMAKNKGMEYPWLAWIPVVNNYLLGELLNEKVGFAKWVIPYAQWILLFAPVVTGIVNSYNSGNGVLSAIFGIISFAFFIYQFAAYYRLYKLYKPESATVYLVVSILFWWVGILIPIFMFTLRNNTPREYLPQDNGMMD